MTADNMVTWWVAGRHFPFTSGDGAGMLGLEGMRAAKRETER